MMAVVKSTLSGRAERRDSPSQPRIRTCSRSAMNNADYGTEVSLLCA